MTDVYDKILEEEDDIPSDEEMKRLRNLCTDLAEKRRAQKDLEDSLKALNTQIWDLETKDIPDLASEIGVDAIGLPEMGVDIRVGPYYKASIPAEWSIERREAAFEYLESIGVGDIIRTEVKFALGKDSMEKVEEILEAVSEIAGIPAADVGKNVPWNTLTAVLRELTEKGEVVDLAKINGVVAQRATIKERKQ